MSGTTREQGVTTYEGTQFLLTIYENVRNSTENNVAQFHNSQKLFYSETSILSFMYTGCFHLARQINMQYKVLPKYIKLK